MATASPLSTTVSEALKEHYKPLRVKEMVYTNNPLLALMPKYEKFGGENMPIPIITTGPQRRSAVFGTGQDNTSLSKLHQFLLTRVKDYSFAVIEHEAIKASESNTDAFLRYATMEVDGAIHSLKRSLAVAMYRNGSGSVATVHGQDTAGTTPGGSSALIYLQKAADITNFEIGMDVRFYADSSGKPASGTERAGGPYTISKVDRSGVNPFITFSGNVNVAVVQGDHMVQDGDIDAKLYGLDAWLPTTVTDSFFTVARTDDPTRLGGVKFDGSALPIEEALIGGASEIAREGGAPDHIFMDFASYSNLEKALGAKVQYDKVKSSDASIGFDALVINGPRGRMKVIPDHNCLPDVAFMLQLDTWSLNTLGAAPQILDADGNGQMMRVSNLDAYEVRIGYYGNVACNAPGFNARIALA
tara:strand:- start:311 stop:1558 length:1248 start_codon:yes stop_codon:yes gene_type:complete